MLFDVYCLAAIVVTAVHILTFPCPILFYPSFSPFSVISYPISLPVLSYPIFSPFSVISYPISSSVLSYLLIFPCSILSHPICAVQLGVFNTAQIISNLKKMRIQTFFGDLEFNAYRRNIAKVPATVQVVYHCSSSMHLAFVPGHITCYLLLLFFFTFFPCHVSCYLSSYPSLYAFLTTLRSPI